MKVEMMRHNTQFVFINNLLKLIVNTIRLVNIGGIGVPAQCMENFAKIDACIHC
jgi:hypothetical protein